MVLGLYSVLTYAGEQSDHIPIFSTNDGSRTWVEVTHSGNRATAVPYLEISGKIVREVETAGATGNRLLEAPAEDRGKGVERRAGVEDFLKRHKSLVVREGPEGVSFGGAFTLLGDIQDGLKGSRNNREKLEAVVGALKDAHAREEAIAGTVDPGEKSATGYSRKSGPSSTGHARPRLVVR